MQGATPSAAACNKRPLASAATASSGARPRPPPGRGTAAMSGCSVRVPSDASSSRRRRSSALASAFSRRPRLVETELCWLLSSTSWPRTVNLDSYCSERHPMAKTVMCWCFIQNGIYRVYPNLPYPTLPSIMKCVCPARPAACACAIAAHLIGQRLSAGPRLVKARSALNNHALPRCITSIALQRLEPYPPPYTCA